MYIYIYHHTGFAVHEQEEQRCNQTKQVIRDIRCKYPVKYRWIIDFAVLSMIMQISFEH